MQISVSIPDALAYGADEAMPSRPAPMSIDDAVYHTVHGAPGGVAALAARMGMSANTLTHKANPNTTTHHMRPAELVDAQLLGGQHHVLHAMAHALGYTCTRATPDQSGGDPVEAQMQFAAAVADLLRAHADAVLAGDGNVTRNMVRRTEHHAQQLIAAANHLVASQRGLMRQAPEVQA